MKNLTVTAMLLLFLCNVSNVAIAQMNNKPFSFRGTINGNAGMSMGGKQVILNDKIYNSTPDNLVRGPDGSLLDIAKGPGSVAIVGIPDGNFIPSFSEHSFRENNAGMSVNVFDAYYIQRGANNIEYSFLPKQSSAAMNIWTSRVISGGSPAFYSTNSSVDTWTGMVYVLY